MFSARRLRLALLVAALWLGAGVARGGLDLVWQIGVDDDPFSANYNPTQEFSPENYVNDAPPGHVTRLPGDPLYSATNNPTADDDFYCAGNYPAGFNGLTSPLSVPNQEPDIAWERALTDSDLTNRVHFFLSPAQTNRFCRLRLSFELVGGLSWINWPASQAGNGGAPHDIVVRFRNAAGTNTVLVQKRVDRDTRFILDFAATNVFAGAGPNTIEFVRTGPFADYASFWILFDYVKLEADTNALMDADGDGLPRWWEEANHLSDTNAADAMSDADGDGLTALQEYNGGVNSTDPNNADSDGDGLSDGMERALGTNPNLADTDGDGLSDGEEVRLGTNPLLADTDGDGLSDGQEVALGTNPLNADTDGDGLSDGAEVNGPMTSNPLLADSNGDGVNDADELAQHRDPKYNPTNSPTFIGCLPVFHTAPNRWEWNLENVQFVWDHNAGAFAPDIWNEDFLIDFAVINTASSDWRTLGLDLRYYNGGLTQLFHSEPGGGFSAPGVSTNNIWDSDYGNPPVDLKSLLGFSGYGPVDISDRLKFRLFAQRAASSNSWTVTFEIRNLTSNSVVVAHAYSNCIAAASLDNGSATWMDYSGNTNQISMVVHQGVQMYFSTNPLASLPAFAAYKDSDKDGMPDAWEDAHGFNKFSAADAVLDADNDGVNNRDEYLLGTDPRNPDTDGDGISDGVERANSSNPLLATSRPEFAGSAWPSGMDLDGDGLPDAWEVRYRAFGLTPNGDADGDGASNAQEAKWGTNPFDSNSVMRVSIRQQTNDVFINWPFIAGKNQRLSSSSNFLNWTQSTLSPQIAGATASARLTNRIRAATKEFYRVSTDDLDSDGDGVPDWAELVLGSDPLRADSTRAAMPIINSNGIVTGSVSGDYASFVEAMRGGPAGTNGQPSRAQAARFLQQATFGPTLRELDRVQQLGFAAWIDDQITNQPATLHRPYIEQIYADFNGAHTDQSYDYNHLYNYIFGVNATTPFARAAIGGPDQLRQRVAFALSQICVTSRREPNLENFPLAMTDYYDIFVRNAFGNYRDVLRAVTFHPAMGRYLSSVGNQKARPEINQYPDENFAREVQQLFSIGLWELNPDGTRKLDAGGQPIPTYNNGQITEFARVFTGLWFGGEPWGVGGWNDAANAIPMQMWAEKHDFGAKNLLHGFVIPARAPTVENAVRDIDDALQNLFEHPNCGPFISRQLIQFLVTSNPSTNYIGRVSAIFANNGAGKRGDLAAVVKAILLDSEARDTRWSVGAPEFGRLKEPVQRAMVITRAGHLERYPNLVWWMWGAFSAAAGQEPMWSPSVFNFFRPNYQPPGLMTANGLVGPAFQITDSYSSISFPNKLWEITEQGLVYYGAYEFAPQYTDLVPLAANAPALLDQINLLFCGGLMTAATRDNILNTVQQVPTYDALLRTQLAVYLAATCPEGAVQR